MTYATVASAAPLHLPSIPVVSTGRGAGLRRQRAGERRRIIRSARDLTER